jgi:raffinose/stachyose/melibiose transport system permease protein
MSVASSQIGHKPRRLRSGDVLRYTVCTLIALVILIPLVVAVLGGLKTNGQLMARPLSWPDPIVWSNYGDVVRREQFWQQAFNSLLVMLATTFLVLGIASSAAFVFARMRFRGRDVIATYFMLGLLFPATIAILPLYIMIRRLGFLDTLWGIILPQVAFALPISVLILRTFFRSIPNEIEDAAYVDGATPFEFYIRILLPLSRPGLSAVAVLTMVQSWNAFFLPLVVLNDEKKWTLPLGVMQYSGQYMTDWARVLAFVTLAMLPAIIFYLFAERQIVAGLTSGALKG